MPNNPSASDETTQGSLELANSITSAIGETVQKSRDIQERKYEWGWRGAGKSDTTSAQDKSKERKSSYTGIINERNNESSKVSPGGTQGAESFGTSSQSGGNAGTSYNLSPKLSSAKFNTELSKEKFHGSSQVNTDKLKSSSYNPRKKADGDNISMQAKIVNGRITPATLQRIKDKKARINNNDFKLHDGSSNGLSNAEALTSAQEQGQGGYYNTRHNDKTAIANTVVQTVKQEYSEADSVQGYKFIRDRSGIGVIMHQGAKISATDAIYNRKISDSERQRLSDMFDSQSRDGKYHISSTSRTFSRSGDYRANIMAVENYLSAQGINASMLNSREIEYALKRGELKHLYSKKGDIIKIPEGSDLKRALEELKYLKSQKGTFDRYKSNSGLFKTAFEMSKDSLRDSDVAQGYQVAKSTKQAATAVWTGGNLVVRGGINTILSGKSAITQTPDAIKQAYSGIRIKTSSSADIREKYRVINKTARDNRVKVREKARGAKVKVSKGFHPIRNTKNKITAKAMSKIEGTAIMQRFRILQGKIGDSKIMKAVKAPFNAFNAISNVVKKIVIALALFFIIWTLIVAIILAASGKMGSTTNKDSEEDVSTTNAQKDINYLYGYQEAYATNAWNCNESNLNVDGSKTIEYRIPASWASQMQKSDEFIKQGHASVFYKGSLAGFDLTKFWGEASDKHDTSLGNDVTFFEDTMKYGTYGGESVYDGAIQVPTDEIIGYDDDGDPIYKMKTIYIRYCGHAGFDGYGGECFADLDAAPDGSTISFNYNGAGHDNYVIEGAGEEILEKWKEKTVDPENISVNYYYRGSQYGCHLTAEKYPYYYPTEPRGAAASAGNTTAIPEGTIQYNVNEFYRGILTMAAGATDDAGSEEDDGSGDSSKNNGINENYEFFQKYSKKLFDQLMDDALVVLTYKYEPNANEEVNWVVTDTSGKRGSYSLSHTGYSIKTDLRIYLRYSGIADMMLEDSKTTYGETGNDWMHDNGSTGVFFTTDKKKPEYVWWRTVKYKDEETMQAWGQNSNADGSDTPEAKDYIKETFPQSKCDKTHDYTQAQGYTIELYNFSTEDWKESTYGLLFPSEINIANFTNNKVLKKAINNMSGILDKNMNWSDVDWGEFTTGDASLDEFMKFATTQGWIQQQTGQEGLCYFTTMMMIAMYMHPDQADQIMSRLTDYAKAWCASDGEFYGARDNGTSNNWESTFNAKIGYDTTFDTPNDMRMGITDQLDNGNPVVLHVKGEWSGPNGAYHKGGDQHFMVIYGYTSEGIQVADPAGTATNKTIPWSSLYEQVGTGGNGYGIRTVTPT